MGSRASTKWIGRWVGRVARCAWIAPCTAVVSAEHAQGPHPEYGARERWHTFLFEFVDGGLDFVGVELGEDGVVLAAGSAFQKEDGIGASELGVDHVGGVEGTDLVTGGGVEEVIAVDKPGEAVLDPEEAGGGDAFAGRGELARGENGTVRGGAIGDGEGKHGGDLLHDGAEGDLFAVGGEGEADDALDGFAGGLDTAVDHAGERAFGIVDDDLCAGAGVVDDGEVAGIGADGKGVGCFGDGAGQRDAAGGAEGDGIDELQNVGGAHGNTRAAVGEVSQGNGGYG